MTALPRHARAVIIGGGVVGTSTAEHLAELGFRGVVLLLAFTIAAGLTTLPRQPAWKDSVGAGMLTRTVLQLKAWLPPRLGDRLRYH